MGYIAIVTVILFYIYAIFGLKLFGEYDPESFGTLYVSLLTLFKILMGEGWSDYLSDYSTIDPSYAWIAPLYFVSFAILGLLLVLNLVIGVICEAVMGIEDEDIEEEAQPEQNGELAGDTQPGSLEDQLDKLGCTADELKAEIVKIRKLLQQ